jgi:ABC-2 type transport system ATP-binding protein
MRKLGKRQLKLYLQNSIASIPAGLNGLDLELSTDGSELVYTFDVHGEETGIASLLKRLNEHGIDYRDIHSSESSLEEIFVSLVSEKR